MTAKYFNGLVGNINKIYKFFKLSLSLWLYDFNFYYLVRPLNL